MRAFCGVAEVAPIHPFILEYEVSGRSPVREGLYIFERSAFGSHCPTVRFDMFSEKDPKDADSKLIDPGVFETLMKP